VNISETFIRRPVATALLMVAIMLAGIVGYQQLPVSALPQVDYPTIVVSTTLPGASPETMASAVTTPIERQLGQMPSLTMMTSISSFSSSQITVQFSLDRNIDAAEQDVQAAINAASNLLPKTLPAPPTYSKSNPADTPVLTMSVSSETVPLSQVDDYADSILAQKISQVTGVGLVTLNGGQKPAVRVRVDPTTIAGLGMSLEDVRSALVVANVNAPKGNLDGKRQAYTLDADDQLGICTTGMSGCTSGGINAAAYRSVIIAYKNGSPVRLDQVADVDDGVENQLLAGWAGAKPAVIINVQRQPGANVIQVADKVKALIPMLKTAMPQGVDINILTDRTETVRASVEDVEFTLCLTIALVVGVIYLFLRNLRATIIPGIAVPLSLIGTFGVMYVLGFSLNNLSLMALTISTGFVVDDAIVMIENVARFIEEGEPPFEAALKGAKQIGFTIISLTVSLIAVLIPLLFMGGIIGRLFREFAITLSIAIGVSAVLSLTLTAMMCAHLLKEHDPTTESRFYKLSERFFEGMIAVYDKGLVWVLRHQRLTLGVTLGTVALTGVLGWYIPKGFFPQQDTGLLLGATEASPDVSFPRMMDRQVALADLVRADPDVESVASFIGADGTNTTTNSGRLSITLKPRSERASSADEIIARMAPKLAQVDGISVYLQSVQDLQLDNRLSRTQYQYTVEDANPDELKLWAPRLVDKLRTLKVLKDVASDQQSAGLSASLHIDRDTASKLGIQSQAIDDTLYDAFGQRQVTTIFTQLNQYRVILQVKPEFSQSPDALKMIYVTSPQPPAAPVAPPASPGTPAPPLAPPPQVPLSAFTHFEPVVTALSINHQGQFPSVTLSFNLAPGESLGNAVTAIKAAGREIDLPVGLHADFQGAAQAFQDSLASEPILILAALLTVYIVLGVLYESYIHPVTIISTLPSAGVGAFLALMIFKTDFSIIALIGVVLLIGIVKKNAIMMIDFAIEAEREEGLSPLESIHKACLLRFRPIMMTTMAALLGGLPLAVGSGTGSEMRRPLGISIVGGLIFSQLLTLYTTPVVYLYMDRLGRFLRGGKPAPQPGGLPKDGSGGPHGAPPADAPVEHAG
jgi:multidrug efflux pump